MTYLVELYKIIRLSLILFMIPLIVKMDQDLLNLLSSNKTKLIIALLFGIVGYMVISKVDRKSDTT
jgi:positive regulator of sigma E activity